MKIYLASSAPGNEQQRERGMLSIPRRLLSFFLVKMKMLENDKIFNVIKYENISSRWNDSNECKG
jgi:hypothetical protein